LFTIESLTKTYGSGATAVTALDDLSLRIAGGEVFGIVGRSGAGKTTLLRCLNLLERPTSGRILLDGRDLTSLRGDELRRVRRDIGVVFQQFNLLHARNVRRNIAFPLEIAGMDRDRRERRVDELLELVGLTDRARAFPSQLSGGQKQRVGIARALAAEPKVLLCDEATSALDTETTGQSLGLLAAVTRRLRVPVVLITHELEVVRRICHSAALIEQGRVVDAGPLEELLADPSSPLGEALLPTRLYAEFSGAASGLLTFSGGRSASPVISELTRDLGIDVTLLAGGVERVAGRDVARIRIGLDTTSGPLDTDRVEKYLVDKGVQVVLS
jgi:D-methionine transport system ATP-binding protein